MLFEYISKYHARLIEDESGEEDVEYVVTPKNLSDTVFSYTKVKPISDTQFECETKILNVYLENGEYNQMRYVLTDQIEYQFLDENDPLKILSDRCFEELMLYVVYHHEI